MSIRDRSAPDKFHAPDPRGASDAGDSSDAWSSAAHHAGEENGSGFPGTPHGSSRKRRRRRRPQGGKRPRVPQRNAAHPDAVSREHVFQDIEGLLRRIREQAEESATWTEEQLREITQTVTGFTQSMEQEGDPISARARSEYQRVREKLSQVLKG